MPTLLMLVMEESLNDAGDSPEEKESTYLLLIEERNGEPRRKTQRKDWMQI